MRTKQKHACYCCGRDTELFVLVRRKVNRVKQYFCMDPSCIFQRKDQERVLNMIHKTLSASSLWMSVLEATT